MILVDRCPRMLLWLAGWLVLQDFDDHLMTSGHRIAAMSAGAAPDAVTASKFQARAIAATPGEPAVPVW